MQKSKAHTGLREPRPVARVGAAECAPIVAGRRWYVHEQPEQVLKR